MRCISAVSGPDLGPWGAVKVPPGWPLERVHECLGMVMRRTRTREDILEGKCP